MVISPVSQLPSQPCLVFEKLAALKIWLASFFSRNSGFGFCKGGGAEEGKSGKCEDGSFHIVLQSFKFVMDEVVIFFGDFSGFWGSS